MDLTSLRRALPPDARVSYWTAPDGWRVRRFDWPAAGTPRGRLLFQAGRADVFEKYLEAFGHWHARGWSVTSFDWRGQGGSGRFAADPHVGHCEDFGVWIADLGTFWREWSGAGQGPRVAIGHSMGGHLILRAMAEGAIDPDAAVLVAPMLGLRSPVGASLGGTAARWMARRGDPARAAWQGNERPATRTPRQMLLTRDRSRYDDEQWWYDRQPELRLGPPSWGWLAEAFGSCATLAADPRLSALTTPLLMLVADADGLVDAAAARRVAARLPNAEVRRYGPESAHEILREADPVRDDALMRIDAFLDKHAA
ncbi:lysophospholipase [Sphingomonas gellani]|uniref:Lysophospholipase n=1 Tax=Sphingomonas gellani TaxID=1166340 RepID=A0A1H7YUP1_9SPHN|nr:alpha/beta hydrolase [Sphingomonas gellani]SEM49820.1 lysophospholipase [Sphingomonas gellani]